MTLPRFPYVVVDQNVLRGDGADAARMQGLLDDFACGGQRILLSWAAASEMTGTLGNFIASTRYLRVNPEAVALAKFSGWLTSGHEIRYQRAVASVVDGHATFAFRRFLQALGAGTVADADLREIVGEVARRAGRGIAGLQYATRFIAAAQGVANSFTPEDRRRVKQGVEATPPNRQPFRESLHDTFTRPNLVDILIGVGERAGFGPRAAHRLLTFPSFAALTVMAGLVIGVRNYVWTPSAQSLQNDGPDTENVLMALYGRGFATNDNKARLLYEDLLYFAARLWP